LGIDLIGKEHRNIVGATVLVEAGGRKQTRYAKGGGSYASSPDRRLVFGLAEADKIDRVEVTWPWGETQIIEGLESDRYWRVTEGEASPQASGSLTR
jgi:hypothetical protein